MKAIRKSDGKVIEVREWRGASDVVYSEPDMSYFYYASDLDFNVEGAEEVTIDREEYEQLCKYRRYFSNWGLNRVECVHCGEINPDGYMCATCGKDPKH